MELNPCPKCGGKSEMKCSFGGFDIYYTIRCTVCGFNNRTHNSAIFAAGFGEAGGFPPTDRNQAIEEERTENTVISNHSLTSHLK